MAVLLWKHTSVPGQARRSQKGLTIRETQGEHDIHKKFEDQNGTKRKKNPKTSLNCQIRLMVPHTIFK